MKKGRRRPLQTNLQLSARQSRYGCRPGHSVYYQCREKCWNLTGSCAKVSNVASLRLVVNGRKELAGKDAWHPAGVLPTRRIRCVWCLSWTTSSIPIARREILPACSMKCA